MKKKIAQIVFFGLILSLILLPSGKARGESNKLAQIEKQESLQVKYVPGEVIIKIKEGITPASIAAKGKGLEMERVFEKFEDEKQGKRIGLERIYKLKVSEEEFENALAELKKDPIIEYVEPNYLAQIATIPNDPHFSKQWGLHNTGQIGGVADSDIDAPEAWNVTKGSSSVKLAILDTGVDLNHPDLKDQIISGYDFVNNDSKPQDDHGHGTHVAGIAAARSNNKLGVAGICWYCKILPIKVCDQYGSCSFEAIAKGLKYAADKGAHVVNMSFGSYALSDLIKDALDYASGKGVLLVGAAGNSRTNIEFYPAAYSKVIAVAATDHYDKKASFSNYGFWVDISAPGSYIYSTYWDNTYEYNWGTSMAAPFITGIAGLVKSKYPTLDSEGIKARILSTADDIKKINPEYYLGTGRANTYNALVATQKPNIIFSGYQIDDSLGNNNSKVERGEKIKLTVSLTNTWTSAQNVKAYLQTSDPYVQIITGVANYGDVAQGETKDSTPYVFQIKSNCPYGREIKFSLKIQATGYSSTDTFFIQVIYPNLAGWPKTLAIGYNQPAVANIAGDKRPEVILKVGLYVYAWHYNGKLVSGWPVKLQDEGTDVNKTPIAIGDITGDGKKEIILKHNKGIHALHHNGKYVSGWPISVSKPVTIRGIKNYFRFAGISLTDLDNDRKDEILVAVCSETAGPPGDISYLYVLRGNGKFFPGWPYKFKDENIDSFSIPVVGDVNNDGKKEIFIGTIAHTIIIDGKTISSGCSRMYGFRFDGKVLSGWPQEPEQTHQGFDLDYTQIALGDLDRDGFLEIISFSSTSGRVFAWRHTGELVSGWPIQPLEYPRFVATNGTYLALGDIDKDGWLEIVYPLFKSEGDEWIFSLVVLGSDGKMKKGWPQVFGPRPYISSPILGDIDGDGDIEILIGAEGIKFYAFHHTGKLVSGWPLTILEGGLASPVLTDLDLDGDIEIIVPSNNTLYVFDSQGKYNSKFMQWPTVYHDSKRSGVFPNIIKETIPPGKPTNFVAFEGDRWIKLTWKNPKDWDFEGVKILRRTDRYPKNSTDGKLIYQGKGTSFKDSGLINGKKYYYAIFAYDRARNYSPGVYASAIPYLPTLVVGAGPGGGPHVRGFDKNGKPVGISFMAYLTDFRGGVNVATGDINGDGRYEIITGAGRGGGPQVRIFDKSGKAISQFFAYSPEFRGGVKVALGDINGDGKDEIITGAGPGGGPRIRVFNWKGKLLLQFFAFHPDFRGGVNVAAGDLNGDGRDEIIAGAGLGGGPHVRVFNQKGQYTGWDMFPFHPNFRGGVNVAAGDVDKDGKAEIGVCQASQGEAWCKVYKYNKAHTILGEWRAYPQGVECGADITFLDINQDGKAEVITGAGPGGAPQVRVFNSSGKPIFSFFAYDSNFRGGVTVAGGSF